jgi:hypothetical protein
MSGHAVLLAIAMPKKMQRAFQGSNSFARSNLCRSDFAAVLQKAKSDESERYVLLTDVADC